MLLGLNYVQEFKNPRILDIGTGTGIIGISLLKHYKNAYCDGIDINPLAVELSNINAKIILNNNPESIF